MIPLLLMLAGADASAKTPVDAERAFAADAKTIGQWTAFRKWSTDDAVMFVPQPANAHDFLKNRKDPPQAIDWWPTASYISCDGKQAVNTGGWRRPDGSVGFFTTVWQRQRDRSWKWTVDGGDGLTKSRDRGEPKVVRASCRGIQQVIPLSQPSNQGGSPDRTLFWRYEVKPDGARQFQAFLWNGSTFDPVIDDTIAAPAK
jgi:hypothetical protein